VEALESSGKMIGIGKTKLLRHLLDQTAGLGKPSHCRLHAPPHQILMRRQPGKATEKTAEVGAIDVAGLGSRPNAADLPPGWIKGIDQIPATPIGGEGSTLRCAVRNTSIGTPQEKRLQKERCPKRSPRGILESDVDHLVEGLGNGSSGKDLGNRSSGKPRFP